MSKKSTQFMACGACGYVIDEDGNIRTSVDAFADGIKSLFSKKSYTELSQRTAVKAH